jgi:hypothetical protein
MPDPAQENYCIRRRVYCMQHADLPAGGRRDSTSILNDFQRIELGWGGEHIQGEYLRSINFFCPYDENDKLFDLKTNYCWTVGHEQRLVTGSQPS